MFGPDGLPKLTYAMFAEGLGDLNNYGSTHPAVQAHAVIGRTMMDNLPTGPSAVASLRAAIAEQIEPFVPNHGG
jgi:beta-lactamase class A